VLTGKMELMESAIHNKEIGGFPHTGGAQSFGDEAPAVFEFRLFVD